MFIVLILLLSVLIALARGASLSSLTNLHIRFLWLFSIPFFLQLIVFTPLASLLGIGVDLSRVIYSASMLIAGAVLLLNWHVPGLSFIGAGLALNTIVIVLNGGFMPVSAWARDVVGLPAVVGRDNNVVPMTAQTVLWWLGDILPLPAWGPLANVYSLGDILAAVGGLWFTQRAFVATAPVSSREIPD